MPAASRVQPVPAPTWRQWLDHWRARGPDRWLSDPRWRAAAVWFWPTRWIARRRAMQVFDLMAGFVYSQVLLACVQLRLFERLHLAGPQTTAALAPQLGLDEPATERLLRAAAALRLLSLRSGGRYGLGPLGAPLVGEPGLLAMIEHHRHLYGDLADPVARLQAGPGGGELARFWAYARAGQPQGLAAEEVAGYSALMAASQPLVAPQVLTAYALKRHRCLLDVGGGDGSFAMAAAQAVPHLRVQVFDLPGVVQRASVRLAQAGLGARSQVFGGDFLRDPLPAGADLITLLRIVHDHDDAAVLHLLRSARAALAPGGRLLLAEPLAHTPGAERVGDAYFGWYLMAMGQGQARSEARLRQMLAEAGFDHVRRCATRMPLQASVLVAH